MEVFNESSIGVIAGDFGRLQQVFWNQLSNAVKFTPKGGRISVRITQAGPALRVAIKDSGKGIKAEFLPYVFQRFRQDNSTTTRSFGGLGLGLAIVRHLEEQHGGQVSVESAGEDKGSTFTVEMPIRAVVPSSGELDAITDAGHILTKPLSKVRVLVVEDDSDSRDLISTVLEAAGAVITAVSSADEALEEIQRSIPDLVVSDIGMPLKDGYELVKELRSRPAERGDNVPVLALTAYAREEERIRALKAGFDEHVPKPVDPNLLVSLVSRY